MEDLEELDDDISELIDNHQLEEDEITEEEEEELLSQTDIKVRSVKSTVSIAGRDLINISFPNQGIKISPPHPNQINKISEVFVQDENYPKALQRLIENRILILFGDPKSGKRTTAIKLALDLPEIEDFWILRFSESASLADFLEDPDCPSSGVFLVNDGFLVPGLILSEMERNISQIGQMLEEKNSYAIITSDTDYVNDLGIDPLYTFNHRMPNQLEILESIQNHLVYYKIAPKVKGLITKTPEIQENLKNYFDVNRFVQKLKETQPDSKAELLEILVLVKDSIAESKNWFDKLKINYKYFAMFVGLFQDLPVERLWDIYCNAITLLQKNQVEILAPLNYSLQEYQEGTNTYITEVGSLVFENQIFLDYVIEQIKSSYIFSFEKFLRTFSDLLISNYESKPSSNIDLRISIASGIGEIGKVQWIWRNVESILSGWATDRKATIRASVAYALRTIGSDQDQDQDQKVQNLLEEWSKSPNSRKRWTVAAVVERLYFIQSFKDFSIELLYFLAKDSKPFVRSAVAHALAAISKRDFIDIMAMLIDDWLLGESLNRKKTSVDAYFRIIEGSKNGKVFVSNYENIISSFIIFEESIRLGNQFARKALNKIKEWVIQGNHEIIEISKRAISFAFREGDETVKDLIKATVENDWRISENRNLYELAVLLQDDFKRNSIIRIFPFMGKKIEVSSVRVLRKKTLLVPAENTNSSVIRVKNSKPYEGE